MQLTRALNALEKFHGAQRPDWPTEPYEFLVWWHCGYPPSDKACANGWTALERALGGTSGCAPQAIPGAKPDTLIEALGAGGAYPEVRAMRLRDIAERAMGEYGGNLRGGLAGPASKVRAALKRFEGIADPGVDRILLFAGLATVAAALWKLSD